MLIPIDPLDVILLLETSLSEPVMISTPFKLLFNMLFPDITVSVEL